MSSTARQVMVALLLVVGIQLWLIIGRSQWGELPHPMVWLALLLLALLPWFNVRLSAWFDRVRNPSPRTRLITAAAIAIVTAVYLYSTAIHQGRDFFLKIPDEHSYSIQARMLATGRLWLAAHPAAESFDAPYLLVRPVYASQYFPGTALFLVPFVWLGAALWTAPLLMSAAAAGVLYRITAELIDGVAGLLA